MLANSLIRQLTMISLRTVVYPKFQGVLKDSQSEISAKDKALIFKELSLRGAA